MSALRESQQSLEMLGLYLSKNRRTVKFKPVEGKTTTTVETLGLNVEDTCHNEP